MAEGRVVFGGVLELVGELMIVTGEFDALVRAGAASSAARPVEVVAA